MSNLWKCNYDFQFSTFCNCITCFCSGTEERRTVSSSLVLAEKLRTLICYGRGPKGDQASPLLVSILPLQQRRFKEADHTMTLCRNCNTCFWKKYLWVQHHNCRKYTQKSWCESPLRNSLHIASRLTWSCQKFYRLWSYLPINAWKSA